MKFRSEKYPSLTVKFSSTEKVRFSGGEADVEGSTARRLAEFADQHPEYRISSDGAPEPESVVDGENYDRMSKKALVAEAVARDLDESGTRADLIARLEADDESADADGEDVDEAEDNGPDETTPF